MHLLYNYTQRAADFAKVNKIDYIDKKRQQSYNIIKSGLVFIIISFLNIIHFLSDLTIFCITKNNSNPIITPFSLKNGTLFSKKNIIAP